MKITSDAFFYYMGFFLDYQSLLKFSEINPQPALIVNNSVTIQKSWGNKVQ
jgi:hypothetical protein